VGAPINASVSDYKVGEAFVIGFRLRSKSQRTAPLAAHLPIRDALIGAATYQGGKQISTVALRQVTPPLGYVQFYRRAEHRV
jgi:hypothetical protein